MWVEEKRAVLSTKHPCDELTVAMHNPPLDIVLCNSMHVNVDNDNSTYARVFTGGSAHIVAAQVDNSSRKWS